MTDSKNEGRVPALVLLALFIALGFALGVYNLVAGDAARAPLGFATPLFILAIPVTQKLMGGNPWRFLSLLYAFCIFAYDIGSVYNYFAVSSIWDKVAHLLSGFLFTLLGYDLYLAIGAKGGQRGAGSPLQSASYALFFSCFVAILWEIFEFCGFVLFGMDSQHTLTTGVFDTMYDLIFCLVGSLACALELWLWRAKGRGLAMAAVAKEAERIIDNRQ